MSRSKNRQQLIRAYADVFEVPYLVASTKMVDAVTKRITDPDTGVAYIASLVRHAESDMWRLLMIIGDSITTKLINVSMVANHRGSAPIPSGAMPELRAFATSVLSLIVGVPADGSACEGYIGNDSMITETFAPVTWYASFAIDSDPIACEIHVYQFSDADETTYEDRHEQLQNQYAYVTSITPILKSTGGRRILPRVISVPTDRNEHEQLTETVSVHSDDATIIAMLLNRSIHESSIDGEIDPTNCIVVRHPDMIMKRLSPAELKRLGFDLVIPYRLW